MRSALVVLVSLLLACGGATTSSAPTRVRPADPASPGTPPDAGPSGLARADLVCTETTTGEPDCVARGCRWGPPLWCSGISVAPPSWEADVTRPCTCTCESDELQCAARP